MYDLVIRSRARHSGNRDATNRNQRTTVGFITSNRVNPKPQVQPAASGIVKRASYPTGEGSRSPLRFSAMN